MFSKRLIYYYKNILNTKDFEEKKTLICRTGYEAV